MKSNDNIGLFTALIGSSAASGNIATVPDTQGVPGDGTASIALGFPPETFIDRAAGGVPPRGQDMNGFLNRMSRAIQVLQAGYFGKFNGSLAAAIGGYPAGAIVQGSGVGTFWVSTADNNTTAPGATGAAWQNLFAGYIPTTGGTAAWLNVTASLNAGLGGPWRGDTAVGGFRYTYGVTIGNPGNSANGAFSANICITDVIGDAQNDRSGIRIRGINYNGDAFETYFAWNGKVTTSSGALASQAALNSEVTRASTAENNLQSAKVNRNGDDGISGSFNVGSALTVGSSFSANAGSGYGFSYRRTTALTGAYDWFSDYGSIKAAILRLMTDGSLNILGSGHFQENGVRVSLIETLIATAAGSVRFTGGFQLVWDTVTIPARTDTSASDSFTATFAKAFTSACWGIVGFDTAQGCHVVSGVANNNNNATLWSYNHGDGNTVTTTKYIAWGT